MGKLVKKVSYCVGDVFGTPIIVDHLLFAEDVVRERGNAAANKVQNSQRKTRNKLKNKGNRNH